MTITITDANIFIDLAELELFPLFFQLNLTLHTTKEVLLECDPTHQQALKEYAAKKLLTIHILSEEQLEKLEHLKFKKGLSAQDKSILYLAYEQQAMVLTGDNLIRKWCKQQNLEVHGILWILEELVQYKLLEFGEAITHLTNLMQINQWLPQDACQKLLVNWQSKR